VAEIPFFFPSGSQSLFAVLHEPHVTTDRAGVVFCHPFGEEKLWSHRAFVTFARALAEVGHPVLRFDYMGNGDSSGCFSDSSLRTAVADAAAAVAELRRRTGGTGVSVLGLRLGATIASLVAEELTDIERLVLWAPIVDGARYMQEMLRINLTTQLAVYKEVRQDREALVAVMRAGGTANVDGYDMSLAMYEEVSAVKLAAAPRACPAPTLVVQIDRAGRPSPELAELATRYRDARVVVVREEPFWKEIARFYDQAPALFATTLEWLVAPSDGAGAGSQ
jgi:exosortase A-associated hydrolase 2